MKTKKNLKPISIDLHLKYRCPNKECYIIHWLSLDEVKTKRFKVVCDCGLIFEPKNILKIKIAYDDSNKKLKQNITIAIVEDCVRILSDYGFMEHESKSLVQKAYSKIEYTDNVSLVRYILHNLESLKS